MANELEPILESINRQADEQRSAIDTAYGEQQRRLDLQAAEIEQQRQATLGYARLMERKEQRKSDLPYSQPLNTGLAENIRKVEDWRTRSLGQLSQAKQELVAAKAKAYQSLDKSVLKAKEDTTKEYERIQAINAQITAINKASEDAVKAQQAALDNLSSYRVGMDSYDIAKAIKDGKLADVQRAGFTEDDIAKAQVTIKQSEALNDALKQLEKYTINGKTYDLVTAIRDGHIDDIRLAGFDSMDVVDAQIKAADKGIESYTKYVLAPYEAAGGGYYLVRALNEGVDASVLRLAGYTQEQIDEAKNQLKVIIDKTPSNFTTIKPIVVTATVKEIKKPVMSTDTMTMSKWGVAVPETTGGYPNIPVKAIVTKLGDYFTTKFTGDRQLNSLSQDKLKELYDIQESTPIIEKLWTGNKITKADGRYMVITTGTAPLIGAGSLSQLKNVLSVPEILAIISAAAIATGAYVNRDNIRYAIEQFKEAVGREPTADEIEITTDATGGITEFKLTPAVTPTIETEPLTAPFSSMTIPVYPLAQENKAIITTSPLVAPDLGVKYTTVPITAPNLPTKERLSLVDMGTSNLAIASNIGLGTIPINWNKLLNDTHRVVLENPRINTGAPMVMPGVRAATIQALDEKIYGLYSTSQITDNDLAAYKQARENYFEREGLSESSLSQGASQIQNTDLIKEAVAAAIASALLVRVSDLPVTDSQLNTIVSEAVEAGNQAAQRAINQNMTNEQIRQDTSTAIRNAVNTKVSELTRTQTQTQTITNEATRTRPLTKELVREITRTAESTLSNRLSIPLPSLAGMDEAAMLTGSSQPIITWKQGFVYWSIYPPYKSSNDVKCTRVPPDSAKIVSGAGSAYKTIQSLGGDASVILNIDLGAFDIRISNPSSKAGKRGAIKYSRDKYGYTSNKITVKGVKA